MSNRGGSATGTKAVKEAKKHLAEFLKTVDNVMPGEIDKAAKELYPEIVALTPLKKGKLEKSVYAKSTRLTRDKTTIVAGASARFRGYNYAGIQHNVATFEHPIKGRDHYVSIPFNKIIAKLKRRLKARMRYHK